MPSMTRSSNSTGWCGYRATMSFWKSHTSWRTRQNPVSPALRSCPTRGVSAPSRPICAASPQIMDAMINETQVGTMVVASAGADSQAEQVISLRDRSAKGIVFLWTGSRGATAGLGHVKTANIPVFHAPDTMARGLQHLLDYHAWHECRLADGFGSAPALTAEQERMVARLRSLGRATLSESESKHLI